MKKLLSLLLVGVVAVSMFGFIRPNRVNAAEVDINSRPSGIVTIESRAKFLSRICATVSKDSKYEQIIMIDPTQPSFRSPSTNSFCVPESKNKINLDFSVYSSNGRRRSIVRISVKFKTKFKLKERSRNYFY